MNSCQPDTKSTDDTQPVKRDPTPAVIIKAKLAVMKAVTGVGKTGFNNFHKYKYSSDYDVMKVVQPAMVEAGLVLEMYPDSIDVDADGNKQVHFLMQWQHEEGEVSPLIPWIGLASDKDKTGKHGDKWFNKAATSAEKYFLIKQLHLAVSDEENIDPDMSALDQAKGKGKRLTIAQSRDSFTKMQAGLRGQTTTAGRERWLENFAEEMALLDVKSEQALRAIAEEPLPEQPQDEPENEKAPF